MLEECPQGFDTRFPGRTKAKIPRKPLTALGPFHEVSADGHEKLGSQALKFGDDVGIPIYTYKDKYTDTVFKANTVRDSRSPGVIGHTYLDFMKRKEVYQFKQCSTRALRLVGSMLYRLLYGARGASSCETTLCTLTTTYLVTSSHQILTLMFTQRVSWLRVYTTQSLRAFGDGYMRRQEGTWKSTLCRARMNTSLIPIYQDLADRKVIRDLFNWIFPPLVARHVLYLVEPSSSTPTGTERYALRLHPTGCTRASWIIWRHWLPNTNSKGWHSGLARLSYWTCRVTRRVPSSGVRGRSGIILQKMFGSPSVLLTLPLKIAGMCLLGCQMRSSQDYSTVVMFHLPIEYFIYVTLVLWMKTYIPEHWTTSLNFYTEGKYYKIMR